jgi:coniferyl-aldehyde dehydrogenase
MLKPSEFTPETGGLLAGMLAETFPEEQVAVVTGDAAVGAAFATLPFDHLLFTGSTPVGRAVMRAASENLVPVTLELGGKSPAIVAPGHAQDRTAVSIAFGKLANAGQTCIAPDYVMVHEDEAKAFATAYGRAVEALYPKGPASEDYTSIINDRHFDRLRRLVEDSHAKGARIVNVGERPEAAQSRPHTLAPAVVLDATDDMAIMQEEIFGPVLPVVTYRSIDEAIAYVNAHPRPLALYYFGGDDADRRKVLSRTTSGNVGINNTLMHYAQDDLPFGGVGPSGMGAYHGVEGFRRMSHAKGIYVQGRWNAADLLRAPFGRLADAVLGLMLR